MKLAVRIFGFVVVIAGAAAASFSASAPRGFVSHQAIAANLPVPGCGPGMCPPQPSGK